MKVAVIGDMDVTSGFGLIGVHTRFVATRKSEVEAALSACLDDPAMGVIIMLAPLADMVRESLTRIRNTRVYPLVVEIPGKTAPSHEEDAIARLVGKAVGIPLRGGGLSP
ncbi:MAG TPA: hypothetical protein ENN85_01920 [Methanoculleus sp.]|nr:hypothetical protein [Methanoculleus sp.]